MPAAPAPSTLSANFACPHCGAHAHQYWYDIYADYITPSSKRQGLPLVPRQEDIDALERDLSGIRDAASRKSLEAMLERMRELSDGVPFLEDMRESTRVDKSICNMAVSKCHSCTNLAIWVYDRLIYPATRTGPAPNPDLPKDILRDYEEASAILALSPRGAAALLRLVIQKLCINVGAQGNNIDQMIGWLVQHRLPQEVQQALDAVRVIGNEAVHPGQMDLRDDGATAAQLFHLVNIIASSMISQPQRIKEVFDKLPATKKAAIAQRDAAAPKPANGPKTP